MPPFFYKALIIIFIGAFVVLSLNVMVVTAAMVKGLFVHDVENAEIFKIIGPAYQSINGCFISLVSGAAALILSKQLPKEGA